jgi:hypothetical protein
MEVGIFGVRVEEQEGEGWLKESWKPKKNRQKHFFSLFSSSAMRVP